MATMWREKYFALAQVMCSPNLHSFLIDLMQEMEIRAVFGFGKLSRDCFWYNLREKRPHLMELDCFRQTISLSNLGKAIDVEWLSEELQKRISYCKTVWGMELSEKPRES
jgi:hypothetical protein